MAQGTSKERTYGSSQGPFCVWQGAGFATWVRLLRLGPPLHWSYATRIGLVSALSLSNSVWGGLESLVYGRRIARTKLKAPPVFILGHWRSGTTLLHELLSLDPQFACPNLYQVLYPQHFLLTERVMTALTGWALPKTRPMDNMRVSWDSPQEDETALMLMTLTSPYLMLAFHTQPEKYRAYFELRDVSLRERERWKRAFVAYLQKITLKTGRTLLLKSPTHTFRIPLLLELFPDAQFINIVRDPYAVINSTIHLRRRLFEANGLSPPDLSTAEEDTLDTYEHLFACYRRDRGQIAPERFYDVRYEELEQDPVGQIERMYRHFGWSGFAKFEEAVQPRLPELRNYRKNEFRMDEAFKRRIYERFRQVFEEYGYAPGLSETPVQHVA